MGTYPPFAVALFQIAGVPAAALFPGGGYIRPATGSSG